ncbi:roadblock/LC7 domain-containing protein [Dactylosporangium sp. CA-233914]|uniref:roadblock/LC7 domain-containing protein n=1 Tax=Dactylosporangium sp. CA-233914 TaxID=3239934 RepID=UPI003D8B373A
MTEDAAAVVQDNGVAEMLQELTALREQVTGAVGCVVAAVDGLLLLFDPMVGPEPYKLAALAAATVGVGRQTSVTLHQGLYRESTIHSDGGYFTVYAVGESALLAVVGDAGMNVARLHLEARAIAPRLARLLQANPVPRPEPAGRHRS